MTDHPPLGADPLAGRDPYPRDLFDVWPLHDARAELLEEIVSQPGAASTASPSRRVLVPVGIVAALALVAGGAWAAVTAGGDDGDGDRTVAASSVEATASDPTSAPDPTDEPATEPTEEPTTEPDDVRRADVRIGKVSTLRECARLLRRLDGDEIRRLPRVARRDKDGGLVLYLLEERRRYVAVNRDCEVIRVGPRRLQELHRK
ncbi:hypothetical protein [Nocardioides stalactiti]|uniref:hypothetical protein n=1 Tax=Nocardioides stalactiti TaxID=2755356 RepID=UPI00160481DD|nr:hypothetical protein [Nocardioides stalactiti]